MKNIKRKIAALMACVIVATSMSGLTGAVPVAAAETKTVGDFVFEKVAGGLTLDPGTGSYQHYDSWKVIGYNGSSLDVVIPDTVDPDHPMLDVSKLTGDTQQQIEEARVLLDELNNGNIVSAVGSKVFPSDKHIQSITLPMYLTEIPSNAFDNLFSLTSIQTNPLTTGYKSDSQEIALYLDNEGTKTLWLFPKGYEGEYSVDSDTKEYNPGVFQSVNLKKLTLYGDITDSKEKGQNLFANSRIEEINLQTNELNNHTFIGSMINRFTGLNSQDGSLIKDGTLLYYGYQSTLDLSGIQKVDSLAFQSEDLLNRVKEHLNDTVKKSTVFRFYQGSSDDLTQRYFDINGKTAFCYDYGEGGKVANPETVGDIVDYDETIETDSEKYNKVKSLLYYGVPNDATGIFEDTFKEAYNSNGYDINADATKNAVGLLLWETLTDGLGGNREYEFNVADVYGIGSHGFTVDNITNYVNALRAKLNEAEDDPNIYNFKLQFYQAVGNVQRLVVLSEFQRPTNVKISKQDATTSEELPGAHLVLKKGGTQVAEWVSESTPHEISLTDGTYELTETIAPDGYVLSKQSVTFTITNGVVSPSPIVMKNEKNKISISKKDATTKEELPGARLTVTGPNGFSESWESTSQPHQLEGLKDGTYTLREETAPNGYLVAEEVTFEVKNGELVGDKVEMLDKPNKVSITKKDLTSKEELPGAKLTLTKDGATIDSWTSTDQPHVIEKLADGTYTLTEESAPNGYKVAESITFTVTNGVVSKPNIEMFDAKEDWQFSISKKDITTNKELPGAILKLSKGSQEIDTWTSTSTPKVFINLEDGTYTLEEVTSPAGYEKAPSITFEITDRKVMLNGVETKQVEMFDKKIEKPVEKSFEISKRDASTRKELPGAKLELRDSTGKLVDSWTSGTTPHIVKDVKDGTYTLTETTAPNGYAKAESVTFTVEDGAVAEPVVMYDEHEIEISKRDAVTKEELPGAKLELRDSDGNLVDSWVSEAAPHIVKGLEDGTYTLTETTAPDGYDKAEEVTFTVKDGKVAEEVVMYDQPTPKTITISKVDATTGKELPGAKLELKDSTGKLVDSWTSGTTPHVVVGINDGEYTLTETTAPNGYKTAESITFTVKDGEVANGPIVMEDVRKPETPDKPWNSPKETQPETTTPTTSVTQPTKPTQPQTTQATTEMPTTSTPPDERKPIRTGDVIGTVEVSLAVLALVGIFGLAVSKFGNRK